MEIDIKVSGDKELAEAFAAKGIAIYGKLSHMNARILNAFHRWVQNEAPRKTGRLKASVQKLNVRMGGSIFMGKGAPYFIYVLDGTRPHIINFKKAGGLFWKGAANPYNHVHHPGTKANEYFDRGYQAAQGEVNKEITLFENWLVS